MFTIWSVTKFAFSLTTIMYDDNPDILLCSQRTVPTTAYHSIIIVYGNLCYRQELMYIHFRN